MRDDDYDDDGGEDWLVRCFSHVLVGKYTNFQVEVDNDTNIGKVLCGGSGFLVSRATLAGP